MSADEEAAGRPEEPYLRRVTLGEFPGLAREVEFTLARRRTILVGQNGAGKSLLVDGLWLAAWAPIRTTDAERAAPRSFACEIEASDGSRIAYRYRVGAQESDDAFDAELGEVFDRQSERGELLQTWEERCWEPATDRTSWRVEGGQLFVDDAPAVPIGSGFGLLELPDTPRPASARTLERVLRGVRRVSTPDTDGARDEVLVESRVHRGRRRWVQTNPGRVHRLATVLLNRRERARADYDEFCAALRDLRLAHEVSVEIFKDPRTKVDIAEIQFDGVNLGYLSEGTLRVVEILVTLLQPATRVLLIEEPEMAVHPGLLERLLAVIDAYSLDRQIVVSTHSPQVVNWGRPEDLRLVERDGDATAVRSLADEDLANVVRHLQDVELADLVFRRERT
jgi:ABC-type Mn2+/Zn2+ transport system ATPase subunit